jgi:hypothetical protein
VGGGGLAPPGVAVLALAAETGTRVSDCTARALTTPLLGESDDESEIVPNPLCLGTTRFVRSGCYALYEQSAARSEDAVTTR